MQQYLFKNPLPILVAVQARERVEKTLLIENPEGFACEISGTASKTLAKKIFQFFELYLSGEEGPLPPLEWRGITPFTRDVLHALTTIPCGQTRTYAEMARAVGSPRGARAIGGACGRNPFPLLLPCHRVVAAGGIGGFSAGLEFKKKLLGFEGKIFPNLM